MPDVAQSRTWLYLANTSVHAFFCCSGQALSENTALADDEGFASVTVILIFNQCHVNVDDIAILKDFLVVGNAVADHVINRSAN